MTTGPEAAALAASFIWAFTSIAFTHAGARVSPVGVNATKTCIAALLFAAAVTARFGRPWDPAMAAGDAAILTASGLLGLTAGDSLLFRAFQLLGTRRATLVFSLNPVLGAVGGVLLLGETMSARAWAGMALALGGIALVVLEDRERGARAGEAGHAAAARRRALHGALLAFGGAAGQAIGALLAREALARTDTLAATMVRVASGGAGLLLLGAAGRRLGTWRRGFGAHGLWPLMLASSLFGPFLGIFLMFYSLAHSGSTGVTLTLLSMTPLWLLPLGWWVQGDRVTRREAAGAALALGGVWLLVDVLH